MIIFRNILILMLFFIFQILPASSNSLSETGLYLSEMRNAFATSKKSWRNTVFQLRKEGRVAKGWDFDRLAKKKGDFETVIYAAYYEKMFPKKYGSNLFVLMPSYTKEEKPDQIEFIYYFIEFINICII